MSYKDNQIKVVLTKIFGFLILIVFPAIPLLIVDTIISTEFFNLYKPILDTGILIFLIMIFLIIFSLYELLTGEE